MIEHVLNAIAITAGVFVACGGMYLLCEGIEKAIETLEGDVDG